MTIFFAHTFGFEDANAEVNNALQIIRDVVFEICPSCISYGPTCALPHAINDGMLQPLWRVRG